MFVLRVLWSAMEHSEGDVGFADELFLIREVKVPADVTGRAALAGGNGKKFSS
jgi:hypothetical protein